VYGGALGFIKDVYETFLRGGAADLELSIDETEKPTAPQAHFFLANELILRGIPFIGVAPRFCGDMEKGVDYKGDLLRFEAEYRMHERIARHFGYKLSIHSGSDKFSVFPIIGRYSAAYHIKTSGTNWLEAVRLIARNKPGLFRDLYARSLETYEKSSKNYHITVGVSKLSPLNTVADEALPCLLDREDVRQLLHIAYGEILNPGDADARSNRDAFFEELKTSEEEYWTCLQIHIGKHLRCLGII
jgi:hypothetical protein